MVMYTIYWLRRDFIGEYWRNCHKNCIFKNNGTDIKTIGSSDNIKMAGNIHQGSKKALDLDVLPTDKIIVEDINIQDTENSITINKLEDNFRYLSSELQRNGISQKDIDTLKKILNKEKDSETFLDKLKNQLYDFSTDVSAKTIAEILFKFLNPYN